MFKQESNAAFNNSLFSCPKIDGMHETAKRLYKAAMTLRNTEGQSAVARLLNASPQTLKNWEARGVSNPGMLAAQRLIGCSATWLETGVGDMIVDGLLPSSDIQNGLAGAQSHANIEAGPDVRGRIPLISWVQAGMWSEAVDIYDPGYAERWLPFLKNNGESTFALRVVGDSMTAKFGKSYPDGCIIFVDPESRTPENGDRIVAKLEDTQEVTFKVFTKDAGRCWLRPLNDSHPPIYDAFSVVGKVIGKWEDD